MADKMKTNRRTIQQQIQVAIIAISILSMLILGVSIFALTTNNIVENYQQDFYYSLQTSDNIVELQLDSIIEEMRNLLLKDSYMNALSQAGEEPGSYFSSKETRTLEKSVNELTLQQASVQEVLSVSLNGKLYIHSKKSDLSQYTSFYKDGEILKQAWIKEARDADGKEIILGSNALTGKNDTLSIVKYLRGSREDSGVGYLIVNVSKNIFKMAFENRGNYKTNCFMVIDENTDDPLIYFQGDDSYKEEIYKAYVSALSVTSQTPYIFSARESFVNGWTLVSGIKASELNAQKVNVGILIGVMILLLFGIGMFVAHMIAMKIYMPLKKLERTMQSVEEGTRNITEEFDDSEIGLLGQKFKEMVNNNLVLRERLLYAKIRQREQELHLLQEQINPHFLYNALDALYCMAIVHEEDEIATMVAALSDNFKLSLNKGSNLIMVKDEIQHIRSYITIQNMRYKDRFHLKIQVDEDLMEKKILKLLLTPFVENAVYHGLETKMGDGNIWITGQVNENRIIFTIIDDGVGIDDMSKLDKGFYEKWKQYEHDFNFPLFNNIEEMKTKEEVDEYVYLILQRIFEKISVRKIGSSHRVITHILDYINQNYSQDFGLNEMAEMVHMNHAYLSILFKDEVGISFVRYLTQIRMAHAKELLLKGAKVQEVSEAVGYNNYRYFCNIFKKEEGVTPMQFKGGVRKSKEN